MAGVLSFTLGLEAGGFLSTAARAQGAITGLVKSAALIGAGAAGFKGLEALFAPLRRGADLDSLSKRTGESVRHLFSLQKAFKEIDLPVENVGQMIFQLNKSLGGFNELGEPTAKVFQAIGLSVEKLAGMQAPEKFQAIAEALARLDNETAANVASKIFGRGSAQDFLQLARSAPEFAEALAKAAPQAEVFARNAAAWQKLLTSFERIKGIGQGFFARIWEGAAPGIQSALDRLNSLDFSGLGKKLGDTIAVVFQAFREDQLGDLVALSLKSGIQDASNFMLDQIDLWAARLRDAMGGQGGAPFVKKVGAGTLGAGAGLLGLWNLVGEKLGVPGAAGKAEQRIEQAERLFGLAGLGGGLLSDIASAGGPITRSNPFRGPLQKQFEALLSRVVFGAENVPPVGVGRLIARDADAKQAAGISRNDWERIGGFGPGGRGVDETARNTSILVRLQERATRALETYLPQKFGPNPMFNNIP